MVKPILHPRFIDHPEYQRVKAMRLLTLSDYLEVATATWAAHHNITLPITSAVKQEDIKTEIEMFTDWILGEVDPLRVIPGGKERDDD